ncbi:MAG: sulfatase family protein [Thermoleophilaceae bacterium]
MRLSRRRFLEAGAAGAAGAAVLSNAGCSMDETGSGGPLNVLLVIIDSLRPDHVGAYGAAYVQTPNVDRVAARGLRFNRAFPEAMVTIPARRSIFTTKRIFPYRDFVPNEELGTSPGWLPIEDTEHTFTSEFRRNGYWVAQVSDNPHLAFTEAYEPFRKSFSHWKSVVGQSGFVRPPESIPLSTVYDWLPEQVRDERYISGMRKYLANSGGGVDEEETCAARVFKEAANTLEEARLRQPFCLTVDCFDPHEPWSPPPKYVDMYRHPDYRGPNIGVTRYGFARNWTDAQLRHLHAIYAAEVTLTDVWFGHFLDRFLELGLDENTVILLLSDHGYLLGERGYTGKVPSQLHPELAQVPFVIAHPDRRAAGGTSSYFASTHDVGPTLLSMVGLSPPGWMEGTDLSPVLDGGEPAERRDFHYGGMYNRFFIRTDEWVLIGDNRGLERHMYDLRLDPREQTNVLGRHRDVNEDLYRTVLDAAGGPLPYYE